MEILHQLGELFLQAAPTVVIVLLFYVFLRYAFFSPLERVLAERKARTEGARQAAETAQAAAKEMVRLYEDALRKARATVYAEQDVQRRAILEQRAGKTRDARKQAAERVAAAKDSISRDFAGARSQLEASTPQLAAEIVRSVFERRPGPHTSSGGATSAPSGAR